MKRYVEILFASREAEDAIVVVELRQGSEPDAWHEVFLVNESDGRRWQPGGVAHAGWRALAACRRGLRLVAIGHDTTPSVGMRLLVEELKAEDK